MKLWLVGRRVPGKDWEVMGIFDTEDAAVSICTNKDYFVGPLVLNEPLPPETTEWPGCYYPLAR